MTLSNKQFYTPGEVAALFGVTPKTVSNWCNKGLLECITAPSGHRRIPVAAIKGGLEYDEKLAKVKAKLASKNDSTLSPAGESIAEEIQSRRAKSKQSTS